MSTADNAAALFKQGFNCSQAVFSAFGERLGIDAATAQSAAAGFGAGIGRKQMVCGAVSGAVMALGMRFFDDNDRSGSKAHTYDKVAEFIDRFTGKHGTTECLRLIGVDLTTPQGHDFAVKNDLFATRCADYVRDSVSILESMLEDAPDPA